MHSYIIEPTLDTPVTLRRDILSYVGTGAIGGIVGYYVGVKELLGIQSASTDVEPSGEETEETATPAPQRGTDGQPSGESPADLLSTPFTETFESGLNGWTIDHRYRTDPAEAPSNPSAGEGSYSEKYDGSARLHVAGGPSTLGVGRQTTGLAAGTTLSATVAVEGASSEPGNVSVAVFAPDGDDSPDERTANNGPVSNGPIELTHTVQQAYPRGTEIRVWADVWPGEFTAYVATVRAQQ